MSLAALLDTTTLSEVMKGRDVNVLERAREYLRRHGHFRFSIITRYEILRGLMAKGAPRQLRVFEARCLESEIFPIDDEVIVQAAEVYARLHRAGTLISDADILIGSTALIHRLPLVTENAKDFARIPGLRVLEWRAQ